jgi:hypothetical protein
MFAITEPYFSYIVPVLRVTVKLNDKEIFRTSTIILLYILHKTNTVKNVAYYRGVYFVFGAYKWDTWVVLLSVPFQIFACCPCCRYWLQEIKECGAWSDYSNVHIKLYALPIPYGGRPKSLPTHCHLIVRPIIISLMFVPCIVWLSITDQHYALTITPLCDTQAPTCFGIHVQSSGSFLCPYELLEGRNGYVVCHVLWMLVACVHALNWTT